ncbi:probable magnesium transporter NIPA4 isoform X2 [Sesamum indicum]|uniref:Probable magnesium transporter n=1 Tax=Sesamum indicum TaxID=4182 RepID=A0A6I9TA67_SESIN|nr:probable magnesium transporter NIPA4 isoform X2 [Sesamum indicum]
MGISKDNLKGFILALLSSGFIGASFIIKKIGLRRAAAASGVRAGVGGYSYLMEPLWWLGMITMVIGEVANFVAYAFAPAVLVTPLGALSIIVSAVLAHFILNERLHQLGILGCIMCITGSIIIVIHAPQEQPISSVQEIWNMATQMAFLVYVGSVIVLVFILVFYFAPQCGHSNVLVFTGICSLIGSLSLVHFVLLEFVLNCLFRNLGPCILELCEAVPIFPFHLVMSVKALGTSLKLTIEGKNQLIYPETWFFMFFVATCVITQMNYLNKALDTFNTAIVSPIYYVLFTSLTILASVIMFKEWDDQSAGSIVSELCAFVIVLSGTILLHLTKDFDRSNCTPLSPTLATRLCNGNGDFVQHDEHNEPCENEVYSRRQEWYT